MNISIIIPNYNGEKVLSNNLPHVLTAAKAYKKGHVEIIIPNDPSTDKSKDIIAKFINSLKGSGIVGKTSDNTRKDESGFSKNVNRGVSLATGEVLILLNNDCRPYTNFLEPLLAHFEDEKVFAVGCMDESIEGGKTVLRGRGVGYWHRGFVFHKAGGLDVLFNPFYWEDIDLSYRALKSGYKLIFEKKSIVVHEHETGVIKTKFKPKFVSKIVYRNQFFFVWKNITDRRLLASHVFWMPYHMITALKRKDWFFIQGFFLALIQIGRVQDSRYRAKKTFIRKDREVLLDFRD